MSIATVLLKCFNYMCMLDIAFCSKDTDQQVLKICFRDIEVPPCIGVG